MKAAKIRNFLLVLLRPIYVIRFLPRAIKIAGGKTYYPGKKRKSKVVRILNNIGWLCRNGAPNALYMAYGLDVAHKNSNEYLDDDIFIRKRGDLNNVADPNSQTCLLRDKYLFYKYLSSNDIATPKVFAVIKNKKLFDDKLNPISDGILVNKANYFLKEATGENASFVKKIHNYEEYKGILNELSNGEYVLQEEVTQHPKMSELNSESINTLRIITVNKNDEPFVFAQINRIGTKATGNVDNWAAGGLAVGINDNGYLKEFAFYKPEYGTKTNVHPDSKVEFSKFNIPMYEEAIKLVLEAHRKFYGVHSIGWDVAITPDGPTLIEGNDNWEIGLVQVCYRPAKKAWEEATK